MIKGLVDTDDLVGSINRIMSSEGTREPLVQQLAMIVQLAVPALQQPYQLPPQPFYGPWTACTYPPGCSGTLFATRSVGDPSEATIEVIGQASSVSTWDGTYSFIVAYMPSGFAPSVDRFALVPSSHTAGTPDSISCAWFKPTGEIAIAFIYGKGQNPLIAWFDAVSIQV